MYFYDFLQEAYNLMSNPSVIYSAAHFIFEYS
jgi:hypothetical protein